MLQVPSTPGTEIFIVKAALEFKTCFSDEGRVGVDGKICLGLNKRRLVPKKFGEVVPFTEIEVSARTVPQVRKRIFLRMKSPLEKHRRS